MKRVKMIFSVGLIMMFALAGCNKDTPAVTPTTPPTATSAPTAELTVTVEPTETPIYAGIPTLDQVAKDSLAQGKEYTGDALYGRGVEQLQKFWGKPNSMLSGLWGDIWHLDEERILIVYYNAEGIVNNFKIRERDIISTTTPVPTEQPKDDPTPIPTNAPVEVDAPFAMVSPVPQSEVVDIVGTMTVETYPRVDGSTATLPLSEVVFMAATGESAEVATSEVVHTKTTNSYNRLYSGEVDLLIVYEPAEVIVERMKTEPLCIKPIGLDALVFLANTANPLQSLTMEQLVAIYSGKITNWADVGGLDRELLAFQRPVNSGSQTLMQKLVMGDVAMADGDNVFRYSTMSDILEGMLSYNNEDNTLGYSVFYYANNMYFEKDFPNMKEIRLEQNYRSTGTILAAANGVIKHNTNRKDKELWSGNGEGKPIEVYMPDNETAEADFVIECIRSICAEEKRKYDDFCVLMRANTQSRAIEEAFLQDNLPYVMSGGTSFFQRKEIKDVISYLRVIANHDDDVNLLRIINTPRRGIGRTTIEKLNEIAKNLSCSLWEAINTLLEVPEEEADSFMLSSELTFKGEE